MPAESDNDGDPRQLVYVIDDEAEMLEAMSQVLSESGYRVEAHASAEEFLASHDPRRNACLLIDAYLPGASGIELLQRLHDAGERQASIIITGKSDIKIAVEAMKNGAFNFLEKPVSRSALLQSIKAALAESQDSNAIAARVASAKERLAGLTPRQQEIMTRVLAGEPSKNIAADLGISQRTVENHRATIMKKTGSQSLPALARLAVAAA